MKTLIELINSTYPLSKRTAEKLTNIIVIERYSTRHKLIEIEKKSEYFYFLFSGIARAYTIAKNGHESNNSLFYKKCYVASFASMFNNTPSLTAVECLTDCVMAKFKYSEFIELADKYIDLNLAYIKSIEKIFIRTEKRDIELATLSAAERYLALKNRVPNIDNIISQKHIASYLGITSVQLSRIKKKFLNS